MKSPHTWGVFVPGRWTSRGRETVLSRHKSEQAAKTSRDWMAEHHHHHRAYYRRLTAAERSLG